MRIFNSLYPYPVLSEDEDYINDSVFYVDYILDEATSFRCAKLSAKFNLKDEKIEKMIENDIVGFYIHLESPRAAYRCLFEVDAKKRVFEVEIDTKIMRQKLEVTAFIILKRSLSGYHNKNINSEIYGKNYICPNLSIGDPLAVAFTQEIEISETNDFQSISSIMKVGKTSENLMNVDIEGDSVYIRLPRDQYIKYVSLGKSALAEPMLSSIVFPSLIYVLEVMIGNSSEMYSSQQWYQVIEKKIESLGYSINQLKSQDVSSIVLAQAILDNPLERALKEIEEVILHNDD